MLDACAAPTRARRLKRRGVSRFAALSTTMHAAAPPHANELAQLSAAKSAPVVASPAPPPSASPLAYSFSLPVLLASCAAGATAGAAVETALYPIDTIKTRLQAARGGVPIVWKGLYAGLAGNIFGVIPASALFMGVYEPMKRIVASHGGSPLVQQLAAATAAGCAASLVRVPTEVVKTRMQTGQFASATAAVKAIVSKEGVRRGLYAGYGSFLLRDLPFDAIEFVAYEQLKAAWTVARGGKPLGAPEVSLVGAAAGVVTAVLTTPLDVVKTRLMTQGAVRQYANVADCFRQIVAQEGGRALFKGVQPRVLWIGLGGSVFFTVLEQAKAVLMPLADKRAAERAASSH